MFIEVTLRLYQLINDGIPFLLYIFRQFFVIPSCLLLQVGYHKQDAVDKSIAGEFTFSQLVQDFLLDSTNDRYVRTLDEDGTLGILAVGYGGLGTEHRELERFFRTIVVSVEVLEPSR